ncbi:MAG TPA: hydroxyacid dehydrogenase [Bacteroidota bacterium]|nr:hydroxyacid dehydrogenase [Bacteroidota bacterium]
MKSIAFFETPKSEEHFLRKRIGKHAAVQFFPAPIQEVPFSKFAKADTISVFIYSVIKKDLLKSLKNLRLIATRSTGFNHIDIHEAKKRGVTVCNVPYYGENTVAEHTFALILSLSRNIHRAYIRTLRNDFSLEGLQGFDLKGKTLGVIGAGSIGLHVIRMAKGFGLNVIAFDLKKNHFLADTLDFTYVSLDELLSHSDIISLHCPSNEHTHHLLNMKNIDKVKKGALFINTARGDLIETQALHYALNSGIFAGAGLDVFEGEELVKDENQMLTRNVPVEKLHALLQKNILLKMENVILTPHMAFDSVEAVERILQTTVDNILAFENNNPQFVVGSGS